MRSAAGVWVRSDARQQAPPVRVFLAGFEQQAAEGAGAGQGRGAPEGGDPEAGGNPLEGRAATWRRLAERAVRDAAALRRGGRLEVPLAGLGRRPRLWSVCVCCGGITLRCCRLGWFPCLLVYVLQGHCEFSDTAVCAAGGLPTRSFCHSEANPASCIVPVSRQIIDPDNASCCAAIGSAYVSSAQLRIRLNLLCKPNNSLCMCGAA